MSANREGRTPASTDLHVLRAWHTMPVINQEKQFYILYVMIIKLIIPIPFQVLLETYSKPCPA